MLTLADAKTIDRIAQEQGADNLAYRAHATLVAGLLWMSLEKDDVPRRFVLNPGKVFFRATKGGEISTIGRSKDESEENFYNRLSGYGGIIVLNYVTREIRRADMKDFIAKAAETAKSDGWNDPRVNYSDWVAISVQIGILPK